MKKKKSDLMAPPSATGGEGYFFENHVQSSFVALMFSKGFAPLFPEYEIAKVMLQANAYGFETDDVVVFLKKGLQERKLLCQVKLTIKITPGDPAFKSSISDAWKDFNNPKVYDRKKDEFLVITSNLCREDVAAVKLLQEIRSANSADEFFTRIKTSKTTSKAKRKKIEDLKMLLQNATTDGDCCGSYPGDEVFFDFYKHIYVLNYDVIEKESVIFSLLYSHLNQVLANQSQNIWNAIRSFVGNKNFHAGSITPDNLEAFLQEGNFIEQKNYGDVVAVEKKIKTCNQKIWLNALLIGGWDNSSKSDQSLIEIISGVSYNDFMEEIRKIDNVCHEVFKTNHNYWSIKNRKSLWPYFSEKFIDDDLRKLEEPFQKVLKEVHPRYSMPVEDRYMARLLGREFAYSYNLRKNISETLAILASVDASYQKCSSGTNESIVNKIVGKLLKNASLELLGSLDDVLSILSEASPNVFVDAIDSSFDSVVALYSQNVNPIWGPHDNVGLSKSFEILAHDEKYFPRVIDLLAEIVQKLPEKMPDNEAFRTLCDILQPYHELIAVSEEIQECAIANMFKNRPDVAWKLSMETLGGSQIVATISDPQWRNWPKTDQTKQKPFEFVRKRLLQNQKGMLTLAKRENHRIPELIEHIGSFAQEVRQELYVFLQNIDMSTLNKSLRYNIWQKLRHECDFRNELRSELEKVRDFFAPTDCFVKNQQYFSDDFYLHLYIGDHDYKEIEKQKATDRQNALYEVCSVGGLNLVLEFSEKIENPYEAGRLFYRVKPNAESLLFPEQLNTTSEKRKNFLSGYIIAKHSNEDKWLNNLDVSKWDELEKKELLLLAPFNRNIWVIVPRWLQNESEYWAFVNLRQWQEDDLTDAIKLFLKYGRPKSALYCLFVELQRKKQIDCDACIQTLLESVSSKEPQNYHYESKQLIQYLQQQDNVDEGKMFGVECAYSPMIEVERDLKPKYINKVICENPDDFAALIRFAYRANSDVGKDLNLTTEQRNAATNSHRILRIWNMIPGKLEDKFDFEVFKAWFAKVKDLCLADDRLDIAMEIVGKKMIYTPADSSGLWIDCRIAEMLNSREGESLRTGFHSEEINSKGAYFSYECKKFVEDYERKADALRKAGYVRFAETLDDLADVYKNETDRLS